MSTTPRHPLLEIDTLDKSLGDKPVLKGVSLTVHPGELVVLLGPNGAGKSTLLGAACGRLAPDTGTVAITGGDPRRLPSVRSALGFVPQDIALYPYLTAQENLAVFARMMGVARRDVASRVDDAFVWAGLTERRHDRVDRLSGGMQRRLNIVASLLHQPALLMLDEPTVGVDVNARERIHELLRRLRGEGLGILLTTHDLQQATTLADRVVILVDGEIRVAGAPQNLVDDVFAGHRELLVTLNIGPAADQDSALRKIGLRPVHDGLTWSGTVAPDANAPSTADLTALGLSVAEISERTPGLESVFMRLTGEALNL